MAATADLPAPWEEHKDEEGQTYFWNPETGASSWTNPAQQEGDLPFGWEQLKDDDGNEYYFNNESGESQWHRPTSGDAELAALNQGLTSGWEAIRDDEGTVYYFNFDSEESSWERPADAGPPGEVQAEDGSAAAAAAQAAATKGAVLPDKKAARRHSVAKALILQSSRAPRMLLPMAAVNEDGPTTAPIKAAAASRKASMLAKESQEGGSVIKMWLKVSDNAKFWRRRFCTYNPEARCIFIYLSEKTRSKKGTVDLVGANVQEDVEGLDLEATPTPFVFALQEPKREDAAAKTTYFCAPTVTASAQLLGALSNLLHVTKPTKAPPAIGRRSTTT